jgi:predicted N-acyltransferase
LQRQYLTHIHDVSAAQWNALAGGNPFLRHEFLSALEDSGCASPGTGWTPQHLVLSDEQGLAAAAPLYRKSHSWGEFVFDFGWARAFEQAGINYFPKLLCAIPFTPATGPRLLYRPGLEPRALQAALLAALHERVQSEQLSSVHSLFLDEDSRSACAAAGWLLRRDCHFQWHNRGYRDFTDFLDAFSAEKRKKARRERRRVLEQGIEFRTLDGTQLDEQQLECVYAFHALTFIRHGHTPYLNRSFFTRVARELGPALLVKLALHGGQPVAAAVFFRSEDTLYGRYWGAAADYHSLHFETCYHQGIDYCIEHGLRRFEPGTQGEHKIARGFEPAITWSAHWIANAPLRRAIGAYLEREGSAIDAYAHEADTHAPFRKGETADQGH